MTLAVINNFASRFTNIPNGWIQRRMRFAVKSYQVEKNQDPNPTVLSLTKQGLKIKKDLSFGKSTESHIGHQIVSKRQFVFTPRDFDATPILCGVAHDDGCISNLYFVFDVADNIHPEYLEYYLWGLKFGYNFFEKLSFGMRYSFNRTQFEQIPLLHPDLLTQKTIVAFLDRETARIDALIEKNERLIDLLRGKRDAYLREHFTPSQSDGCRLRFVTAYQKGRITAGSAKDEGDVPLLTADYVRHGQVKLFISEAQPDVNNGDVLILWDGAGAGDILQGREGVLSSTLARFTPNLKVDSEYLFYALKAREGILKNTAQGMGIPHVDGKVLKNLVIKLPSKKSQSEMKTMARRALHRLQELENKTRQMNAFLKEKRSALIAAAVTGQIDIPE